jgi:hypothetical protein
MLFAYGMQESRNEVADMLKYVTLGGVTVYPLLFILLSIDIKRRPVFLVSTYNEIIVEVIIGCHRDR